MNSRPLFPPGGLPAGTENFNMVRSRGPPTVKWEPPLKAGMVAGFDHVSAGYRNCGHGPPLPCLPSISGTDLGEYATRSPVSIRHRVCILL